MPLEFLIIVGMWAAKMDLKDVHGETTFHTAKKKFENMHQCCIHNLQVTTLHV
jgi:hypothetical protein